MKVFISWSGTKSNKIAMIFRQWLPSVIQSLVPYVSSEDIDKGARWSTDIATELEDSTFGILCVTKENLNAPWLCFELEFYVLQKKTSMLHGFALKPVHCQKQWKNHLSLHFCLM